jgi:hypothetical protein
MKADPNSHRVENQRVDELVIGDGWAALAAVALLAQAGRKIVWLAGSGTRLLAPLPTLEPGQGPALLAELGRRLGVEVGPWTEGMLLREFRNKSFRLPSWKEPRGGDREECLWAPEQRVVPEPEGRFEHTLVNLEEKVRAQVAELKNVERGLGLEVSEFRAVDEWGDVGVVLASGQELRSKRVIFADRWNLLPSVGGLPKPISILRGREPMGALQARFQHSVPMGVDRREGFFGPLQRESGEEFQRSFFGHFLDDGTQSVWTLFMASEEGEDNHEITKRLRRLKQALDKMFTGESWLPAGKKDFLSTVAGEQVRFEEASIFSDGETVNEPCSLPGLPGVVFLTDGCGVTAALRQVAALLGQELSLTLDPPQTAEASALEGLSIQTAQAPAAKDQADLA